MVLLRVVEVRVDIVPDQVLACLFKVIPLLLVLEVLMQLAERLQPTEVIVLVWATHQPLAVAAGGILMLAHRVVLVAAGADITGLAEQERHHKVMREEEVTRVVVGKLEEEVEQVKLGIQQGLVTTVIVVVE